MVNSFGIEAQIFGVKNEWRDRDESLDGSLHDSHMVDETTCGSTHYVFKNPWSDLESLLNHIREDNAGYVQDQWFTQDFEYLVRTFHMEERQSGVVERFSISNLRIIIREMEEMNDEYLQLFMD